MRCFLVALAVAAVAGELVVCDAAVSVVCDAAVSSPSFIIKVLPKITEITKTDNKIKNKIKGVIFIIQILEIYTIHRKKITNKTTYFEMTDFVKK